MLAVMPPERQRRPFHFENALISVDNTVLQNVKVLYKFLIQKNKLEADSLFFCKSATLSTTSIFLFFIDHH